jgi:hypothetical protein
VIPVVAMVATSTSWRSKMSKHLATPTSRLVCFGGGKACTNAVSSPIEPEDRPGLGFGE